MKTDCFPYHDWNFVFALMAAEIESCFIGIQVKDYKEHFHVFFFSFWRWWVMSQYRQLISPAMKQYFKPFYKKYK